MADETRSGPVEPQEPTELPPEALDRVAGGISPVEFGEAVAAFVMAHMF
jgi:hypothetical protein